MLSNFVLGSLWVWKAPSLFCGVSGVCSFTHLSFPCALILFNSCRWGLLVLFPTSQQLHIRKQIFMFYIIRWWIFHSRLMYLVQPCDTPKHWAEFLPYFPWGHCISTTIGQINTLLRPLTRHDSRSGMKSQARCPFWYLRHLRLVLICVEVSQ